MNPYNKASSFLALSAAALMLGADNRFGHSEKNSLRPEDIDVTPKSPIIQKGLKSFIIEGVEVFAINRKNAIKKYNKLRKESDHGKPQSK